MLGPKDTLNPPARFGLFVGALLLLLTGCGAADDGTTSSPDSTVGTDLGAVTGRFAVVSVATPEDRTISVSDEARVTLDDELASISVETGCNRYLGSYSFFTDGRMSVTLTGGTDKPCPAEEKTDQILQMVLSVVDRWERNGDEVTFGSDLGYAVDLRRVEP